MISPSNNKIIVSVDSHQKDEIKIGENILSSALKYEVNYRYKSPTIAKVEEGNLVVKKGELLLIHHNLCFMPGSPYHLQDDLFSIPFSPVIFARIGLDGSIEPLCGNMIVDEIEIELDIPLPPEYVEVYKNRYKVVNPGWTEFKPGQTIFTRPSSGYQIVYTWNQEQRIIVKVNSEMVCGVLK